MKKLFYSLLLFLVVLPSYWYVHAESIKNFNSSIVILQDGKIDVTETIEYDFDGQDRHGIFRDIPYIKKNAEGKSYRLGIDTKNVSDEHGDSYEWNTSTINDNLRIKIGSADKTVTGIKIYNIHYIVSGALTYFSDHDELYWNITGNTWTVPIQNAKSHITLPKTDSSNVSSLCYTGVIGSTQHACTAEVRDGENYVNLTDSLYANEGLTTVFSFPKGIVAVLEPQELHSIWENPLFVITVFVLGFLWYIALPVWIGYRWWRYGRDPKPTIGQAHVWFDPPKTKSLRSLTPAESGTLLDEKADVTDIAATIVDLARRKFLTIVEDKKQYTLLKANQLPNEQLQPFEKILFEGIFKAGNSLSLKSEDISNVVSKTQSSLYTAVVTEGFFDRNPETTRTIYMIIGILGLCTGNLLLFISGIIFGKNMPKKTGFGSDQAAIGKALKTFLSSQERFLSYQAEKMALFEKLLPYAVAFGVEKIWAKRFENIALTQPSWYVSSSPNLNTVLFVNSLSNSMYSFKTAATPTTSSSGFSSGSSGGFSGGGGGGGGGGSW